VELKRIDARRMRSRALRCSPCAKRMRAHMCEEESVETTKLHLSQLQRHRLSRWQCRRRMARSRTSATATSILLGILLDFSLFEVGPVDCVGTEQFRSATGFGRNLLVASQILHRLPQVCARHLIRCPARRWSRSRALRYDQTLTSLQEGRTISSYGMRHGIQFDLGVCAAHLDPA
jgi:hypothetical protein